MDEIHFAQKVKTILIDFLARLEDISYDKYNVSVADILNLDEIRTKKILERANGIISDFHAAYNTALEEYENLVRQYYRVPAEKQRESLKNEMIKLKKDFNKLLRIINVKAEIEIENLEDFKIHFKDIEKLKVIAKINFEQIEIKWKEGSYF